MRNLRAHISVLLLLALFASSCSNTKYLPAGERLYRGAKINLRDKVVTHREWKMLRNDLTGAVHPRPNSKFLGIRLKLRLYNWAGGTSKKTKGLRYNLRNKVGEPPVLTSSVHLDVNKDLLANMLQNRGYFHATVNAHFNDAVRKKSQAVFDITTGPQYTINKVEFERDASLVSYDVDSNFNGTLLKPGVPYNLDLIKAERSRIDRMLKEKGYYYFRPDYILVETDSSIGNHKVNMYVTLKHREIPEEAYNVYKINDIFVYASYRLRGKSQDTSKENKVQVGDYYVIDNRHAFKPKIFANAMVFHKGELYSLDDQNTSLSRLVNMGTFKFVKNRFDPITDSLMDVYYYLTPFPKKSLRLELGAITQSDNRSGTTVSLSWRNRNAFKGAEEVLFKIRGGLEAQYGPSQRPGIYNLGAELAFSFPKFIVPFADIKTSSIYLPRTIIKGKYRYESEINVLTVNSYSASYGYDWKEGPHKEHQLFPINFTDVKTDTINKTVSEILHPVYTNLIFNGIIFGPTYEYTYNSQIGVKPKNGFYFDFLIDLSGNIVGLAQKANYETNPQAIAGVTYAQYVKMQPDLRYYWHISSATTIAARALAGIGIPYGNSSQLPNIKQFWAGGNSDLRGFPSRLVGPGTFHEYNVYHTDQYIQTLGDLKLEANLEWRQNLYKFINGALFIDAGNIWLYRDNLAFPGGTFTSNFIQQIAVDAGIGLRLDFQILLLRLDLGIPVSKPWTTSGYGFTSGTFAPGDMVLNLAIGYPF